MRPSSLIYVSIAIAATCLTERDAFAAPPPNTGPSVNGESLTQTTRNGPAEHFGGKGQLAISSEVGLNISSTTISGGNGSTTNIQLAPAADYFVVRDFSLGALIGWNYTSASAGHASTFIVGVRAGYDFDVSDLLSIWPKAGLSIADNSSTTSFSTGTPGQSMSTTSSSTNLALNLYVPIMFHPATHFFVGFGPFLDTDLSGDARATTWGGKMTIGGWMQL